MWIKTTESHKRMLVVYSASSALKLSLQMLKTFLRDRVWSNDIMTRMTSSTVVCYISQKVSNERDSSEVEEETWGMF